MLGAGRLPLQRRHFDQGGTCLGDQERFAVSRRFDQAGEQRPSQAAPTPRPWRAYAGPACNRTPNAFVTLRIVAKLGLPSSLKAR